MRSFMPRETSSQPTSLTDAAMSHTHPISRPSDKHELHVNHNSTPAINRLPSELLCCVFVAYADVRQQWQEPGWRLTLLHVCREWRDVAMSFSLLWKWFVMKNPGFVEFAMSLAGDTPLVVEAELDVFQRPCLGSYEMVFRQFHRVQQATLTISTTIASLLQACGLPPEAPSLERLEVHVVGVPTIPAFSSISLPRLTELKLAGSNIDIIMSLAHQTLTSLSLVWASPTIEVDSLLKVLAGLPFLRQLVLERSAKDVTVVPLQPPRRVTLPYLRKLDITECGCGITLGLLLKGLCCRPSLLHVVAKGNQLEDNDGPYVFALRAFREKILSPAGHPTIHPRSIHLYGDYLCLCIVFCTTAQSLDLSSTTQADVVLNLPYTISPPQVGKLFMEIVFSAVDLAELCTLDVGFVYRSSFGFPFWDHEAPWMSRMMNLRELRLSGETCEHFFQAVQDLPLFLDLQVLILDGCDFGSRPQWHDGRTLFGVVKRFLQDRHIKLLAINIPANLSTEEFDALVAAGSVEEAKIERETSIVRQWY